MRICPFCSTENEAFFRFCLGCGADLDEAVGAEDDAAAAPEPAPLTAGRPSKPRAEVVVEANENGPKTATVGLPRPGADLIDPDAVRPSALSDEAPGAAEPGVSPTAAVAAKPGVSAAVAAKPGVSPAAAVAAKAGVSPAAAVAAKAGVSPTAAVAAKAGVSPAAAVAGKPAPVAVPPEFDVLPDVSTDATQPDVRAVPKPRVSSKDTAVDMPAVTPEMLAQMNAAGGKDTRASRPVATRAAEPSPPTSRTPAATPGSPPPRVARDRDKTLEPGGAVKPGSAASQAVAQAQGDVRRQSGPTEQVGAGPAIAARAAVDHDDDHSEPVRTKPTPVSSPTAARSASAPQIVAPAAQSPRDGRTAPSVPAEGSTRRSGSPDVAPPTAKRTAGAKSKARLVIILEDGTDGAVLDLSPETTVVGREGVDISFPHDDFLAKRHAEFTFADGALYLRPLESTNGVFLQVHQEVELENGDVFRIGQQLLCFEMLSMVAASLSVDPKGQAIPLGSPVPEGAWGRLGQLIAPDTLGSVYLLGGNEVYLGRERGDITFPGDGFVSGLHAQISMRNGRCFLKDLGSSNGTYLRLSKATPVKRGMLVLAGQQLFRIES